MMAFRVNSGHRTVGRRAADSKVPLDLDKKGVYLSYARPLLNGQRVIC
jgi:hypothetical protein